MCVLENAKLSGNTSAVTCTRKCHIILGGQTKSKLGAPTNTITGSFSFVWLLASFSASIFMLELSAGRRSAAFSSFNAVLVSQFTKFL